MAQNYVTKEEFQKLLNNFNDLVTILNGLELKQKADFDSLYMDDEDVEEEELDNLSEKELNDI